MRNGNNLQTPAPGIESTARHRPGTLLGMLVRIFCFLVLMPMLLACSTGAKVVDGTTGVVGKAYRVIDGPLGRMDADLGGNAGILYRSSDYEGGYAGHGASQHQS